MKSHEQFRLRPERQTVLPTERNAVRFDKGVSASRRLQDFASHPRERIIPEATGEKRAELLGKVSSIIDAERFNGFSEYVNAMAELFGGSERRRPFARSLKSLSDKRDWVYASLNEVLTTDAIEVPGLGGTVTFRAQEKLTPYRNEIELRLPQAGHDIVLKIFHSYTTWSGGPNPEANLPGKRWYHGGDHVEYAADFYMTPSGAEVGQKQLGRRVELDQDVWAAALAQSLLGIERNVPGQRLVDTTMTAGDMRQAIFAFAYGADKWPVRKPLEAEADQLTLLDVQGKLWNLAVDGSGGKEPTAGEHKVTGKYADSEAHIYFSSRNGEYHPLINFNAAPTRVDFMSQKDPSRVVASFFFQEEPNIEKRLRERVITDHTDTTYDRTAPLPETVPVSDQRAKLLIAELQRIHVRPRSTK